MANSDHVHEVERKHEDDIERKHGIANRIDANTVFAALTLLLSLTVVVGGCVKDRDEAAKEQQRQAIDHERRMTLLEAAQKNSAPHQAVPAEISSAPRER